jgi:hypothetical protein
VTPRPRRGQIWTVAGPKPRRVVIYSGNMLNDIDEEHVVTMEVIDYAVPLGIPVSDGSWIRYTWLDHTPKESLSECVGEVAGELMESVNTRLFMVITTS